MTEQALKKAAPDQIQILRADLDKLGPQFKMALPSHISVEKFQRVVITAVQTNPKLATCDRGSFWAACMKAAQDGLLPDGRECAIVPFKNNTTGVVEAQYLQMIAGVLKKVRNSGELSSISPHVVYEKDEFKHWVDENGEHFKHVPCLEDDPGQPRFVYCMARLKDGSVYFERMSKAEIEAVRSQSKASNSLKWTKFWGEGAKVSVTKRLAKRLPSSTDIDSDFFKDDGEDFDNESLNEEDETHVLQAIPKEAKEKSQRLRDAVLSSQSEEEPPIPAPQQREPGDDTSTEGSV